MFSQEQSKTSPWKDLNVKDIPWVLRWCSEFEYILCSQADLQQLIGTDCNLICIALYAPEHAITEDRFLLSQAKGTFAKILDPIELNLINLPEANPFQMTVRDLQNVLLNPQRFGITDKKVLPLSRGISYDPNDTNTVYVAFSVEGCHSLSSTYDKDHITVDDILTNLRNLSTNYPVLSVNLTHLEQYPLCNHAFGALFVTSESFKPTGKEIAPDGITLVKECYRRNILIDLKHMSLGARRFLIENLRTTQEFKGFLQPLVCTHAGFTGLSYKDIPDYINELDDSTGPYSGHIVWAKPRAFETDTWTSFNPSSINLYDEDIMAILTSGGMIGLSLDKRILGFTEVENFSDNLDELSTEEEYYSKKERSYFIQQNELGKKCNPQDCITNQDVLDGGQVNPAAAYYHLCHFMSHILHLIRVAARNNYDVSKALTQVCIGSDFDGIINPIWCCPTVASMADFKKNFISEFPLFAKTNRDKVTLPAGFDIYSFAEQLFFENGKQFLLGRLSLLQS